MLVSNLPILYITSSPLNCKRITLLRLLEPSNDKCVIVQNKNNLELIKLLKIMMNLHLKRLHINYAKQGYEVSTIVKSF